MKFIRFSDKHLLAAAQILAERHRRERQTFSALPEEFENPVATLQALEREWNQPNTIGIAALEGEQLVGYLIGTLQPTGDFERSIWIKYPCLGIAENQHPELYRQLYANIAHTWVSQGCFDHYVQVPAGNQVLLDAWFRLGFAYQQVYGLLDLEEFVGSDIKAPENLEIRLAQESDREKLRNIAEWIKIFQAQAPTYCPILPESLREIRDGYAEIIDEPEAQMWLVVRDGDILGFQAYWPLEAGAAAMTVPANCIELAIGAVSPAERGRGIGTLLTNHCFRELRQAGFRYVQTDWRMTNLMSSTFWPARGFRPVVHRLSRHIDERVLWANGHPEK